MLINTLPSKVRNGNRGGVIAQVDAVPHGATVAAKVPAEVRALEDLAEHKDVEMASEIRAVGRRAPVTPTSLLNAASHPHPLHRLI